MRSDEIRILCVDNEQSVLSSIRKLFTEKNNYTLITAESGDEGLKILEETMVQVVISDGRMYGMTGSEFLREVCIRWPETVRIALTGHAEPASVLSNCQIYRFIPKPWNNDDLKLAVSDAVERYNLIQNNLRLNAELQARCRQLEIMLREKEELINLRSGMLSSFQNILNAVPTGILGIDPDNLIVQCNTRCSQILGHKLPLISEKANDVLPAGILECIEDTRKKKKIARRLDIHGVVYCALGVLLETDNQRGVVISLLRADEL